MALTKNAAGKWAGSIGAFDSAGTRTIELDTAGKYVDANIVVDASVSAGSISASAYNSTSQTGNDLSGYTEQTVTVPSEGSLVLSAGYYPKTFITLDAMLDGKPDTAGTAATDLKSGKIAYDVDGKKLTGTMPQLTSANFTRNATTLGGGTATISGPTYNSTTNKFDITSSGSASKTISVTASKEGWVAKDATVFSGTISSGTISGSIALDKSTHSVAGNGDATITAATLTNTQAATGTIGSTAITPVTYTTQAAAGANYIKVRSTAKQSAAGSISIPVKCTSTEGYTLGDEVTFSASGSVGVTQKTGDIYFKVYNGEIVTA